jgi:hypothetical protein
LSTVVIDDNINDKVEVHDDDMEKDYLAVKMMGIGAMGSR